MQPHNLTMPMPQALEYEAALSLQHVFRIADALDPKERGLRDIQVLLCWIVDPSVCRRFNAAWERMAWVCHFFDPCGIHWTLLFVASLGSYSVSGR